MIKTINGWDVDISKITAIGPVRHTPSYMDGDFYFTVFVGESIDFWSLSEYDSEKLRNYILNEWRSINE